MRLAHIVSGMLALLAALVAPAPVFTQTPVEGEVRQIVSFTLQPGASAEVRAIYREELLELYRADPAATPLTAFVRYRIAPGMLPRFRQLLQETIVPLEERGGWPSASGIDMIGDGSDVLRWVGFESLGDFEAWDRRTRSSSTEAAMDRIVAVRTVQLLVSMPEFVVR